MATRRVADIGSTNCNVDESELDGNRSHIESYNTNENKESYHGILYQLRILILFIIKAIGRSHSFSFATGLNKADKFDDIVFRCTINPNTKQTYRFLQVKHWSDSNKKITLSGLLATGEKEDFSLLKCFDYFMKMKEKFKDEDIKIRDLIIFSNIGFKEGDVLGDFTLQGIFEHIKNDQVEDIVDELLQTKLLRFKGDFDGREKWITHIKENHAGNKENIEDDIKLFLEKLAFATAQPGIEELKKITLKGIKERYNVDELETAYSWLQKVMHGWTSATAGTYFTHHDGQRILKTLQKRYGSIIFGFRDAVSNFTGRQHELDEMRNFFEKGIKMIVITGPGGIGKTQLAKKFITCNSDLFDSIIWLSAECYEDLLSSVQRLAIEKLDIKLRTTEGCVKKIESILEEIYHFFCNKKSIFVFDNVENLHHKTSNDNNIKRFLPKSSSKPFVLITSRCQSWDDLKVVRLGKLSEKEATDLIGNSININTSYEKQIKTLAKELEYFPLAIQQALAFIKESRKEPIFYDEKTSIGNYLELFQQKYRLKVDQKIDKFWDVEYKKVTWTALNVNLALIQEQINGEAACKILKVISYFAPEKIYIKDIANCFQNINEENLRSALYMLCDYSMISIKNEVTIHRIVQQVMQQMVKESREEEHILTLALTSYVEIEVENAISLWEYAMDYDELVKRFYRIPQHVLTKLREQLRFEEAYIFGNKYMSQLESILGPFDERYLGIALGFTVITSDHGNIDEALHLIKNLYKKLKMTLGENHQLTLLARQETSNLLTRVGNYSEALMVCEDVFQKRRTFYGEDHPNTLRTMFSIANIFAYQCKLKEAIIMYERILQKQETLLGSDHPHTLKTMQNLGNALQGQGKFAEANLMYEKVLQKRQTMHGNNHPDTLTAITEFGNALQGQGNFTQAILIYERALEMQETVLGYDHPDTLQTMSNLANALQVEGKFAKAISIYERQLQIQETMFGDIHPDSLQTMSNLANAFQGEGNFSEAKLIYEKVLRKQESTQGNDPFDIVKTMSNLGIVLQCQGNFSEAILIYERVLQMQETMIGDKHPDALQTMSNLANAFQGKGKFAEAKSMYEKVLQKQESMLGNDHPDTLKTMKNLGIVLQSQGKFAEVRIIHKRVLQKQKILLGDDDPETLSTMNSLANAFQGEGRYVEAKLTYEVVLQIQDIMIGDDHPEALKTMNNLGIVLQCQGKFSEATLIYEKLLQKQESLLEDNDPDILKTLQNLGNSLQGCGKFAEAKVMNERVLLKQETMLGDDHPDTLNTLQNLGILLQCQGNFAEAKLMYERILQKQEAILGKDHPETLKTMNELAKSLYI